MKKLIMLSIILTGINSCSVPDNSSNTRAKIGKQMETTSEKIDTLLFQMNRGNNNEYMYRTGQWQVLQRYMSDNNVYYYYERKLKDGELVEEYRRFFSSGKLNVRGFSYKNHGFPIGVWSEYNEDGILIREIDKDEPFKNYPWNEVRLFMEKEYHVDFFDKHTIVHRYLDKTSTPVYDICWRSKNDVFKNVIIDINTRKVIKEEDFKAQK
ncbi:hypothetical protein [Prevotella fusca]|uniref:Uncharacterized protein n=1 Tax=Prevotella fusca JCM 17724 TaxID=1236517 RepID=A0A0K1NJS0_9BACT|nr:hypothetical protein [Prevotella fusca]AKU69329.1 hypothetical protein ADJ77_05895 [Prevotella fusca JCM 17724]QUB86960.1 hypothetical protein J5A51_05615 [Prevotella fusca JCM 17724]